ncbi:MAG: hypothetical protein N2595_03105 [bacterium]|nr:hypothetical protein [bacterium]
MTTWRIVKTDHRPAARAAHNAVFTCSNGYWALSGILLEDRGEIKPTTIVNGVYDLCNSFLLIPPAKEKRYYLDEDYFAEGGPTPAVANLPSPLHLRLFLGKHELSLQRGSVTHFRQTLDLRSGLYSYRFRYTSPAGHHFTVTQERFCDLHNLHLAWLRYRLHSHDFHGLLRLLSGIDGSITSNVVGDHQFDVTETAIPQPGLCLLHACTRARRIQIQMGVRHSLTLTGRRSPLQPHAPACATTHVEELYEIPIAPGQTLTLEKCMFVATSEDARHHAHTSLPDLLHTSRSLSFDLAFNTHKTLWRALWRRADVQIDGDPLAQRYLRFCLFHLIAAAPRHTDTLSVPVKLLSGEYYQGNTFYDTDTYIVPFYTYTQPQWARHCLHWRYLGLQPGRQIARSLGFPGAKLAWQAGPYGEECLGRWWHFTHSNIHINADVAYAMLQYSDVTGDLNFMWHYGVEFLIETARFYAARAVRDPHDQKYHYHDCAGPDEGHCTSTDNFYTNYLAQQTLYAAATWVAKMQQQLPHQFAQLARRLALKEHEPAHWRTVADNLAFRFNPATNIFEQFDGFFQLHDIGDDFFARRRDRKEWFAPVRPYQAIHQPDVVMALVLFRPAFSDEVLRANHSFYYPRTMNFSSMSFAIHAIACAELGELDEAYKNFIISAGMDLDEELTGRHDTHHGLHGTAMGGAWMAAIFGFAGVRMHNGTLHINPRLPSPWRALRFPLTIHGEQLHVHITPQRVHLRAGRSTQLCLPLRIAGQLIELRSGASVSVPLA